VYSQFGGLESIRLKVNKMGSVRHRLAEARHDCNVVLIGDAKVGKSALINRFINNKFSEVKTDVSLMVSSHLRRI
jgi:GTPase SAR1 family protein